MKFRLKVKEKAGPSPGPTPLISYFTKNSWPKWLRVLVNIAILAIAYYLLFRR